MKIAETMENPLTPENVANNLSIARALSGKTIKECGLLLGIPTSRLINYENGKHLPSLPELESLSFLLRIPVTVFFKENGVTDFIHSPDSEQLIKLLEIRQQIIGTKILIAREAADTTLKELSKITSIPTSRIKRYEAGTSAIPLDELIAIFEALNLKPDDFFDHDSPIGEWQNFQSKVSVFKDLPEDIKGFITDSKNLNFLRTAQALSIMGIEKFHHLSDALTDLTNTMDNSE
ncbi:MAG: helix-turn-helix transcriptional regulator [Pelolinea sp.]|nr:helix-turn-helix transcriptional regulator [Pelolinea sp.]